MQVNFLRENPVLDGMQQAQQLEQQRARAELVDMEVQARREQARQDRAASEALNRIYATGEKLNSGEVNRRLAADPSLGGGRRLQALKSAEEQDVSRQQMEAQARERDARAFKAYVDSGLYGAAAEQARRMGLNIPAEFWANKEKVAALREKLEIEDKRAGINQKNAAAGASNALRNQRGATAYDEYPDEQNRVVRVERGTGKSSFVLGPDGQPLRQAPTGGAAGGRSSVFQERYQAWLKTHPGDEAGALRYAASERDTSIAEKVKIATEIAKQEAVINPTAYRPAFRKAMESFGLNPDDPFGARSNSGAPGALNRTNGSPTAPKDAADVPRGQDGRVDHRQLVDGQVYLIPLKKGGQTTGRWNAQTGRFDEVN